MPKFPKLPKNASRQEMETFLDKIIESGSGKTARKVDYFRGGSFPAFRLYNNADPSRGVGQEYENQYHLKPTAVRREALKQIRKNPNEGFEIREVQIGTGWDPNVHHTIWRYEPPKPRRRPIRESAPVYVPINSDADIDSWMKSVGADPRDAYTIDDLAGAYWEVLPDDQEVYQRARKSRHGGLGMADMLNSDKEILEMSGGRVNRLPAREYVKEKGWYADDYGMQSFPWGGTSPYGPQANSNAAAKIAFPQLSPRTRNIITRWYEDEGALDDFEDTEELADYMKESLPDMLDAADDGSWARRIKKKLGY